MSPIDLALANLLAPPILFFLIGMGARLAHSDLEMPESVATAMALYLLIAIGVKGGAAVATAGVSSELLGALAAGIVLSFLMPIIAYAWLRAFTALPALDAAAAAGHYGSISIVTLLAGKEVVASMGIPAADWMVAVAAAMEAPAILTALLIVNLTGVGHSRSMGKLLHEVFANGSIVLFAGAFAVGWITGAKGLEAMAPLIVDPFLGIICVFLLSMGLKAGDGLRTGFRDLGVSTIIAGCVLPLIGAVIGTGAARLCGLDAGSSALFITLAASASYIAVPAALKVALPEARPGIYLTMALGITFPFNITIGLPLYIWLAQMTAG